MKGLNRTSSHRFDIAVNNANLVNTFGHPLDFVLSIYIAPAINIRAKPTPK
jgi:hypothetical protein